MVSLGLVIGFLCCSMAYLIYVLWSSNRETVRVKRKTRDRDRKLILQQVDRLHSQRVGELARFESLMEKFELEEQKQRSARVAEHRREVARIGHDHPEERTRLIAAHREELSSLDQGIASRRAAYLARLEREPLLACCFRPWASAWWQQSVASSQLAAEERRNLLERQLETLRQDRAERTVAHEARLAQLDVEHRLKRARRVAGHQLELVDIGRDRPGERATMLAAHSDELAVLDQDACDRRAEFRAVKREWMKVRDRCDHVYVDWLVICFLPDVDADTRKWIDEHAAALGPCAGEGHALPVATAS